VCPHNKWCTQHITYNTVIGWTLYLASEDDDVIDDSDSLVLQELLNDVFADGTTGPDDGEVCVS
jgi:hypothetical protein